MPHLLLVLVLATLLFGLSSSLTAAATGAYVYARHVEDLAPPEAIVPRDVPRSTRIYDRQGRLLYEVFAPNEGRRTTVPLSDISRAMVWATIATEDAEFYQNPGVNPRGLARAALINLQGDAGGGSSITQQLVKNVLIPPEERDKYIVSRKIKEMILSIEITRRFSKDQILEWYLNHIYFGNLSHGVEAASQGYFGKSARDLSLAEAALLAGLPQSPSDYAPTENPELAKRRQEIVLDLMVRHGFITAEQAGEAKAAPLVYAPQKFTMRAPHFVQYVRSLLEERYGKNLVESGGLQVYTTLDLELQERAEQIVLSHIERLHELDASNAAAVAIAPESGEILALVGSADFFASDIDGQVNVATSPRQPGSAFKPFVYATAFQKGWTPATWVQDVRTEFANGAAPPYLPHNVDDRFRGSVTVREALATSLNIPAVKALEFAGVEDTIATARRMGLTGLAEPERYGLSLALGGAEIRLLDLVYAYSAFATNGVLAGMTAQEKSPDSRALEPIAIRRAEDAYGRVVEEVTRPEHQRVLPATLAYQITHILSDDTARSLFFGPDSALKLPGRPAAVKTGTTDEERDNWTIGYTPDLAVGVWVGNSDGHPMRRAYGSLTAAPLWRDLMMALLDGRPVRGFSRPAEFVEYPSCGEPERPGQPCHKVFSELFPAGAPAPTATVPPGSTVTPTPTITATPSATATATPTPTLTPTPVPVFFTRPAENALISGEIDLMGTADLADLAGYQIEIAPVGAAERWERLGIPRPDAIRDGVLVRWDSRPMNGEYLLRLSAVDGTGRGASAIRRVRIDNEPPRVAIREPAGGAIVPAGQALRIVVEAVDPNGIAGVEVLVDGVSAGPARGSPAALELRLSPGRHSLVAVARDQAGNSARGAAIEIEAR